MAVGCWAGASLAQGGLSGDRWHNDAMAGAALTEARLHRLGVVRAGAHGGHVVAEAAWEPPLVLAVGERAPVEASGGAVADLFVATGDRA
jgi:hypothetical protein